jgi:hypothetical protein
MTDPGAVGEPADDRARVAGPERSTAITTEHDRVGPTGRRRPCVRAAGVRFHPSGFSSPCFRAGRHPLFESWRAAA